MLHPAWGMISVSLWSMNEAAWNEIMARWQHIKSVFQLSCSFEFPNFGQFLSKPYHHLTYILHHLLNEKFLIPVDQKKISYLCTEWSHSELQKYPGDLQRQALFYCPNLIYYADPLPSHIPLPTCYEHLESFLELRWNSFPVSHR